jgi:hypothetical protein
MRPPSIRLTLRSNRSRRCAYCLDDLEAEAARGCAQCGLQAHDDCLSELGPVCATVGCGGATADFRSSAPLLSAALKSTGDWPRRLKALALTMACGAATGGAMIYLVGSGSGRSLKGLHYLQGALVGGMAAPSLLLAILTCLWVRMVARRQPALSLFVISLLAIGIWRGTGHVSWGLWFAPCAILLFLAGVESGQAQGRAE